jgi:hypothetical protein
VERQRFQSPYAGMCLLFFLVATLPDSSLRPQVFLPAIAGHVPDNMVRCIAAFTDFCYLARHSAHTTSTLRQMEEALDRFHHYHVIFVETGVRADFELPRQHALVHFVRGIKLFGSPNGLCTSITKLKHIDAVKKPWRPSSRFEPIDQIIATITRIAKIIAARVEFGRRGMLPSGPVPDLIPDPQDDEDGDDECDAFDGTRDDSKVTLGARYGNVPFSLQITEHSRCAAQSAVSASQKISQRTSASHACPSSSGDFCTSNSIPRANRPTTSLYMPAPSFADALLSVITLEPSSTHRVILPGLVACTAKRSGAIPRGVDSTHATTQFSFGTAKQRTGCAA